jgi:hypothetical protein
MSEKGNLETLKKLQRLETRREKTEPSRNLRAMARRLAYLHERRAAVSTSAVSRVDQRTIYEDQEIDAINWLMAHYAAFTGYDVRSVLLLIKGCDRIDLERYDRMMAAVRSLRHKRETTEQDGSERDMRTRA